MTTSQWRIVGVGLALAWLGACGQKGPLYLPDKNPSAVPKPATASPEAARPPQKIDPEKKDDSQNEPTP